MIRENNDLNDYDSLLTVIVIIIKSKDILVRLSSQKMSKTTMKSQKPMLEQVYNLKVL
jgi:hypothetical protein